MAYELEQNSDRLVFEFKNSVPIELIDLTRSLSAVSNQYRRFIIREDIHESAQTKLYVKEVRPGSTIVELFAVLQEYSPIIGVAIATSDKILDFAIHLKKTYDELRGGKEPSTDMAPKDVADMAKIMEATAKDPDGRIVINAYRGATVQTTVNYNSSDANTIQNRSYRLIETMRETEERNYKKRSFYWDTAFKGKPRTSDKGVIETIERRAIPVIFEDDAIKDQMIAGKEHPFTTTYIVDVELIISRGKTKAYKITKVHEIIVDDDNEDEGEQ